MAPSALIIGAGIVGVSAALHLQLRGWDVVLVDRKDPGSETSYGNAGVISRGSILPPNTPGLWKTLPASIAYRNPAVRVQILYVLRNLRWISGFLGAANSVSCRKSAAALNELAKNSLSCHLEFMEQAGCHSRLRKTGFLKLFRSRAGLASHQFESLLYKEFGISYEILNRTALSELEPSLANIFSNALWIHDSASVDSPGKVTRAYAHLFESRGGEFLRGSAVHISVGESGVGLDLAAGDRKSADHIVIAAGPWSDQCLAMSGFYLPLGFERGYHHHFGTKGNARLNRPVYDAERGYVLAPMDNGIRLTSGVELNHRDAPADYSQINFVESFAREIFPITTAIEEVPWRGSRPTLPDGLPMIGQSSRSKRLWIATGHGHIGFSTGPVSGKALAQEMNGEKSIVDLAPFAPRRYSL